MKSQHILVTGAGIGGLTAAIALAQGGHQVEVLEQAAVLGAIGAGVTLAPNAMRVFSKLGLEAALCEVGMEPRRQRVQHWQDGRTLLEIDRGNTMRERYGVPYLTIHRADLHAILIAALEATGTARVRLSATAVGARRHGDGAVVELADGEIVEGDAVVAADGIKSPIRRSFEPEPAHFTGHIAWRAVVPVQGADLVALASYPGVHIGPGRMVVRYPVSGGSHLNLVFFARQQGWAEEGWAIPGSLSELESHYGDWSDEVAALRSAIDERQLFKWGVFARRPLPSWVKDDRVALLGDAAHAMTPFLGQGAGCAIEDAMVLARCLSASGDLAEAFRRYERARMERCAFIQEESNANADRMQGDESHLYGMKNVRNEETLGLFAYDACTVPV